MTLMPSMKPGAVPHGHRHISEQTHARIAKALDRVLSEANSGIGQARSRRRRITAELRSV
jgi:hypothetical protein